MRTFLKTANKLWTIDDWALTYRDSGIWDTVCYSLQKAWRANYSTWVPRFFSIFELSLTPPSPPPAASWGSINAIIGNLLPVNFVIHLVCIVRLCLTVQDAIHLRKLFANFRVRWSAPYTFLHSSDIWVRENAYSYFLVFRMIIQGCSLSSVCHDKIT